MTERDFGAKLECAHVLGWPGQRPKKLDLPRCRARCRSKGGLPCFAPVVTRRELDADGRSRLIIRTRCRMHGGLSTGPKTSDGQRRCAEAGCRGAAERWRRWREQRGQS
jgi:hypothetical protein